MVLLLLNKAFFLSIYPSDLQNVLSGCMYPQHCIGHVEGRGGGGGLFRLGKWGGLFVSLFSVYNLPSQLCGLSFINFSFLTFFNLYNVVDLNVKFSMVVALNYALTFRPLFFNNKIHI